MKKAKNTHSPQPKKNAAIKIKIWFSNRDICYKELRPTGLFAFRQTFIGNLAHKINNSTENQTLKITKQPEIFVLPPSITNFILTIKCIEQAFFPPGYIPSIPPTAFDQKTSFTRHEKLALPYVYNSEKNPAQNNYSFEITAFYDPTKALSVEVTDEV
ncbi:MAG: hypothetical protein RLZ12_129 [Bacillota bacterium]|jgi:hypothetical protein